MNQLFSSLKNFIKTFKSYQAFQKENKKKPNIVFFSEMFSDHMHLKGIIEKLIHGHNQEVIYLASSEKDKLLDLSHPNLKSFYIGEGIIRTILFRTINSKLFIMTMPDLEVFHLKRSVHPVHYVYIFHSLVSTHMIYRHRAFDAYDTIFIVGDHQRKEIRYTEKKCGLREKQLIKHGYSRLDQLVHDLNKKKNYIQMDEKLILIAPSWGKHSISNTCVIHLVHGLLNGGFKVIFRPHPMTVKNEGSLLNEVRNTFENNAHFELDTATPGTDLFLKSAIMVSDWSGAALEFSFGLERPVVFIDTPKKINNVRFSEYDLVPIEDSLRSEIGAIVKLENLDKVPEVLNTLIASKSLIKEAIIQVRSQYVYNFGKSDEVAASKILALLKA